MADSRIGEADTEKRYYQYHSKTGYDDKQRIVEIKWTDTVGELGSAKICVSHMPSWKVKKLGKPTQEKVLPEL
jgi:hypothetical protein